MVCLQGTLDAQVLVTECQGRHRNLSSGDCKRTKTVFADEKSATAKSNLPSPLKLPAAMPLAPIGAGISILGLECAVAIDQQYRNGVVAEVWFRLL